MILISVTASQLSQIIVDLIEAEGGEIGVKVANDASRQMMKMLSSGDDGSGGTNKLSEQSFLGWVHTGSQMPGAKRRKFSQGSEARRAMILLL